MNGLVTACWSSEFRSIYFDANDYGTDDLLELKQVQVVKLDEGGIVKIYTMGSAFMGMAAIEGNLSKNFWHPIRLVVSR